LVPAGDKLSLLKAIEVLDATADRTASADYTVERYQDDILVGVSAVGSVAVIFPYGADSSGPRERIRLASLAADRRRLIRVSHGTETIDHMALTVELSDRGLLRVFCSLVEVLIEARGTDGLDSVWALVQGMARVFQASTQPSIRSVTGLLGEILFIAASANRGSAVDAWADGPGSRFDFTYEGLWLDVKSTQGRSRRHSVSLEQLRSVGGVSPALVSFCLEIGSGMSVRGLLDQICQDPQLTAQSRMKFEEKVALAVGDSRQSFEAVRFDFEISLRSGRVYAASSLPTVGDLDVGVSQVHFVSDFELSDQWVALDVFNPEDPEGWIRA
jgi:hypothetical protein